MHDSDHTASVIVIGAGFSAVALALQLARRGRRVCVIGPADDFARGLAYGSAQPEHLLNVPAERMGIDPDAPGAFADALGLQGDDRRRFMPRRRYGDYLAAQWQALQSAHPALVESIHTRVTALTRADDGVFHLTLDDGRSLHARQVVLALGTATLPAQDRESFHIADPWAAGALDAIVAADAVLIRGTSLTMIDIVATLLRRGHRGRIVALSRRGLLPRLHPEPPLPAQPSPPALLEALRAGQLRAAVRNFRTSVAAGVSPDALADGLRPHVSMLWRGWSMPVRRRFLRHLRPWWDQVRHRVPGEVMRALEAAGARGQFAVLRGHLQAHADGRARIRPRGAATTIDLPVRWCIDATGWDSDPQRFQRHPALQGLIGAGNVLLDSLGLGLCCDADGRALGRCGPTPGLFIIGSLRRGECWESSAVPELRVQATALAECLAAGG